MIDIVRYRVAEDEWTRSLGFSSFVHSKDLNIALGGHDDKHQQALSNAHVDILIDAETLPSPDRLHSRTSGLNQVSLKLAKKNSIALGFAFSSVLEHQGMERAILLGRMMQNVRLCRKYKVSMVLCSFAKDKWELRKASDLLSFGRVLGMTQQEVLQALNYIKPVKAIRFLST